MIKNDKLTIISFFSISRMPVNSQLLTAHYAPSTKNHQLRTTNYEPQAVNRQLRPSTKLS